MSVNYCNQSCEFAFRGKRKTSAWIRRTAAAEGWETGAVSVVFCSDEALLEINRRYLKHDYYTDIITFDYSDPDKRTIAGDLMISVDTVRDNARELGVPFENELQRVIIHGIQQRMRKLEDRYLKLFYEQTN